MSVEPAAERPEDATDLVVSLFTGTAITVGVFLVLWPIGLLFAFDTFTALLFLVFGAIPAVVVATLDGVLLGLPLVVLARWIVHRSTSVLVQGAAHLVAGLLAALIPLAGWWALEDAGLLALWMRFGSAPWFVATVLVSVAIATLVGWRATEHMVASGRRDATPGWPQTLGFP
jgi:hypothetical protein